MNVACPGCGEAVTSTGSRSKYWTPRHRPEPLIRALRAAGLLLFEDWVECRGCGYDGAPEFSPKTAVGFVYALEHRALEHVERGEAFLRQAYAEHIRLVRDLPHFGYIDCDVSLLTRLFGSARLEFIAAQNTYIRALAIFPGYAPALLGLSRTLMAAVDVKEVETGELNKFELQSIVRFLHYVDEHASPRIPYVDWLLGRLHAKLGAWDEAHDRIARYVGRTRIVSSDNPFANEPVDATGEAQTMLIEVPQLWIRHSSAA